jgi:hypothetical protein
LRFPATAFRRRRTAGVTMRDSRSFIRRRMNGDLWRFFPVGPLTALEPRLAVQNRSQKRQLRA